GPCARLSLRLPVAMAASYCRMLRLPCTTTAFNAALAAKCTCSSVRSRHASSVSAAMIVVSFLFVEDIACRVFPLDSYRWTDIVHVSCQRFTRPGTPFCSRFFSRVVMIPMFLSACMSLSLLLPAASRGLGQRRHRQGWCLLRRHRWPGFGDEAAQGQRGLIKQRHQDQVPTPAKDTHQPQAGGPPRPPRRRDHRRDVPGPPRR